MKMLSNIRTKREYTIDDPDVYDWTGSSDELCNRTISKGEGGTVIDRAGNRYLVEFCDWYPDENDPNTYIGWNIILCMKEEDMEFDNPDDKFLPWDEKFLPW
ncbi:MAG: hypothetical protein MJ061_04470 [Mailhella sp.]|nr:hypothetical protein [Mailhella sp.]